MKKNVSAMLAILLLVGAVLAGCSKSSSKTEESQASAGESAAAQTSFKVGMVADVGGVNDKGYNQSAWEGMQKLEMVRKGVEVKYLESQSDADYDPNLNQFVQQKWDLIWGIGFAIDNAMKTVAKANPDKSFGIVDSDMGGDIPANVASVTFKEEDGSFLVGVIAGLMTKSNQIGFVGGVDFATIHKFEFGFKAGVKAVNPQAEVVSVYAGAFNAPDLGKQTAATMYDKGVDIIYHAAGSTGDGIFNEAKERKTKGENVWVIGVNQDQSTTFGKEVTLTSMIKRVDQAILHVSSKFIEGSFEGGKQTVLGLAEDGVGIAPTSDVNVPKDILNRVVAWRERIIKGEFKVPATKEDLAAFQVSE